MRDVQIAEVAGRQFNRISRAQLLGLGLSDRAIVHRVATGRLITVEEAVYALAPLLEHDQWGRWMGSTLTAPGSVLSHVSAGCGWGMWSQRRAFEVVTRPGSGGPRRHGGVLAYRSLTLEGESTLLHGIPITTPERTLLDVARTMSYKASARTLREAVRLELTSLVSLGEYLGTCYRRRGSSRLATLIARYSGLPLERARSGAEIKAMEILRSAGRPLPRLNVRIAGEEADLSWPQHRLIIEIDGGPWHLDVGEDERKEMCWTVAGWTVHRIPADAIYENPQRLLDIAPHH